MADRGSYRAVKVVLLDGPNFQELPERENHLFVFLKLSLGPSGIEVHYPEALAHLLSARTRIPVEAVRAGLDHLERAGWIKRQGNVIWIVGQLEHDPHMDWSDEKHRKSIWKHVAGLPRLAIVGEFVAAHPLWFNEQDTRTAKGDPKHVVAAPREILALQGIEGPTKGLRRAIEAPITENDNREPKTEERTRVRANGPPAAIAPELLSLLGNGGAEALVSITPEDKIRGAVRSIRQSWLYDESTPDATPDPTVKGKPPHERRELVARALVEMHGDGKRWNPALFAGFVRNLRYQPPPRDAPTTDRPLTKAEEREVDRIVAELQAQGVDNETAVNEAYRRVRESAA